MADDTTPTLTVRIDADISDLRQQLAEAGRLGNRLGNRLYELCGDRLGAIGGVAVGRCALMPISDVGIVRTGRRGDSRRIAGFPEDTAPHEGVVRWFGRVLLESKSSHLPAFR